MINATVSVLAETRHATLGREAGATLASAEGREMVRAAEARAADETSALRERFRAAVLAIAARFIENPGAQEVARPFDGNKAARDQVRLRMFVEAALPIRARARTTSPPNVRCPRIG